MEVTNAIPPPENQRVSYPWEGMKIGDSFFAPGPNARNAAMDRGKRHGEKYRCRAVVENDVKGIRVWRVS